MPLVGPVTESGVGLRFLPKITKKARETNVPVVEVVLVVARDRALLDGTLARLHAALLLIGAGALGGLALLVRVGVRGIVE